MTANSILILEKNRLEFLLFKERLLELGFAPNHLTHCTSLAEIARPDMKEALPSFVFADLFLTDSSGIATFQRLHKAYPDVPIVILTDPGDKETALQCIHLGAQDFLVKGEFSVQLLRKTIQFASERNAYRQELEKLTHDYQNLFRKNPMPMWVFDFETLRFLSVNKAAVEKYGYSEEEFHAMTIEEIHPKEDLEKLHGLLATATPNDAMSSRGIWRHLKKNGDIIYVEIFSSPVMYKDRLAAIGSSIDVTEKILADETERQIRKEVDAKSRQIEEILESISDSVFVLDKAWTVKYWNPATEAMYGIARQDAIGRNVWSLFPNGKSTVGVAYERALHNQKTEHFEYFSPVTSKWMAISVYPTQEEGLTVHIKDLTEERRLNLSMMEAHSNYEALINFMTDDIWSIGRNLELLAGNRAFRERMLRLTGREIQKGDQVLSEEMPAEEYAKWKGRYETALNGEHLQLGETVRFHNGDVMVMEVEFNPIRDTAGAVIGVACHSHQIRGEA